MRKASKVKEMDRWLKGVFNAEERLKAVGCEGVHVMDREGDSYDHFAILMEHKIKFVIRACHDRTLSEGCLFAVAQAAPLYAQRTIFVSKRGRQLTPKARKIYPERSARQAVLTIRATSVSLQCSGWKRWGKHAVKGMPETVALNIVSVVEENPPAGEPPVCWRLLSTQPIETAEQILAIVDAYRARWLIESAPQALKTGCQYQALQLESYDSLLRALAIYLPIAWQLLRIRYLAGVAHDTPAEAVLNPVQIEVLRAISPRPLPQKLTARQALLAIAAKGGHIKNNGDPGWMVLGRGLHDLLLLEQGWRAAMQAKKCDQS